jgi:hypothetical protein
MNIIVDRPQLVRVALLYLDMNFGNLTPKTNSKYPNSIFYVDSNNEILMEYDKRIEHAFIHYGIIWSRIGSLFSLNYSKILSIIEVWLVKTYNLRNLIRIETDSGSTVSWELITNLNDI